MAAAAEKIPYQRDDFARFTPEQKGQLYFVAELVEKNLPYIQGGRSRIINYKTGIKRRVNYLQRDERGEHPTVFQIIAYPCFVCKLGATKKMELRREKYEEAERVIGKEMFTRIVIPDYTFYTLKRGEEPSGFSILIERTIENLPDRFLAAAALWRTSGVDEEAISEMVHYINCTGYTDVKPKNVFPVSSRDTCYLVIVDADYPSDPDAKIGISGDEFGFPGLTMCAPQHLLSVIETESRKLGILNEKRFQEERERRLKMIEIEERIEKGACPVDDWSKSITCLGKAIHKRRRIHRPNTLNVVYTPDDFQQDCWTLKIAMRDVKEAGRMICDAVFKDKPNSCWVHISFGNERIFVIT